MIKIDKNIPLPSNTPSNGRARLYPWLEMEVNDSFVVFTDDPDKTRRNLATRNRPNGKKFKVLIVEEPNPNDATSPNTPVRCVRVWRTA